MHFHSIPARVRDHDSGNTLGNGIEVRCHVDVNKALVVNNRVVFVDSISSTSISHEVLGARSDLRAGYDQTRKAECQKSANPASLLSLTGFPHLQAATDIKLRENTELSTRQFQKLPFT